MLFFRWEFEGERYLPQLKRASGFASASELTGTGEGKCPLADLPPPPSRPADFLGVLSSLKKLGIKTEDGELYTIFHSEPEKTKLEQFFRLLYYIQNHHTSPLPIEARPLAITETLIAAKVFSDPSFPNQITRVVLKEDGGGSPPRFSVYFKEKEVRFPLNEGAGFAVWEMGKCQHAKELVFYNGFSFYLKEKGRNLVADDFEAVELFGDFGARKGPIKLDLNYVELERVEFLHGTDEGRVKSRVAKREFATNPHSFLFRFIGRLIPDHSRQRIDW